MAKENYELNIISEVVRKVCNARKKDDKIKILKENDTAALCDYLRGTYDSSIQWNLPAGAPPYTASEIHNAPSSFRKKNVELRHFVKGLAGDKLPAYKREHLFINLLEAIDPREAELLIEMINKKKRKGITRPVIEAAFPNLLQD